MSITINALPVKTWKHMQVNDAQTACPPREAGSLQFKNKLGKAVSAAPALPTGAGADEVFDGAPVWEITASVGETVSELVTAQGGGQSVLVLRAEPDSSLTVYVCAASGALRLLLEVGARAKLRLVELLTPNAGTCLIHDVGAEASEDAAVSLLHLYLGRGDLFSGVRTDLVGAKSSFAFEAGYLEQGTQTLDVNLIANHLGANTTSRLRADGTLKGSAHKTFRGTIDFKRGAKGSVGAETESVLLLGDGVVNKTVPLILCAEEDVQGDHGATIGELDEDTLFYFASRGFDAVTAENLLTREKLERLCTKLEKDEMREAAARAIEEVL